MDGGGKPELHIVGLNTFQGLVRKEVTPAWHAGVISANAVLGTFCGATLHRDADNPSSESADLRAFISLYTRAKVAYPEKTVSCDATAPCRVHHLESTISFQAADWQGSTRGNLELLSGPLALYAAARDAVLHGVYPKIKKAFSYLAANCVFSPVNLEVRP
jgi:hypothetical protein